MKWARSSLSGKFLKLIVLASVLGVVGCGAHSQSLETKEQAKVADSVIRADAAEMGQVSLDLSGVNVEDQALLLVANTEAKPVMSFLVIAKGTYPGTQKEWTIKKEFPASEKLITIPKVPSGKVEITLQLISQARGVVKSGTNSVLVKKGETAAAAIILEAEQGSLVIKVQDGPYCPELPRDPRVLATVCTHDESKDAEPNGPEVNLGPMKESAP